MGMGLGPANTGPRHAQPPTYRLPAAEQARENEAAGAPADGRTHLDAQLRMKTSIELTLTLAELEQKAARGLEEATCVVFDVLRATSTIVTALHQGAREVIVVGEITEALALSARDPDCLLAGERGGRRITAAQTGSIPFDLGNSPREFTPERVAHRAIVMTTTNGTRALHACRGAKTVLAASFLNLRASAEALSESSGKRVVLVCAGTGEDAAYEDVLGAGALLRLLEPASYEARTDTCLMATALYDLARSNLESAFAHSTNGRRLAADPDLRPDLAFCVQRDTVPHAVQVVQNIARLKYTPLAGRPAVMR
jgi:2-phosphosulfolactate phosphatase